MTDFSNLSRSELIALVLAKESEILQLQLLISEMGVQEPEQLTSIRRV